jgi:hypothetical protein
MLCITLKDLFDLILELPLTRSTKAMPTNKDEFFFVIIYLSLMVGVLNIEIPIDSREPVASASYMEVRQVSFWRKV